MQALIAKEHQNGIAPNVYQLHGGIQRYLEHFHDVQTSTNNHIEESSEKPQADEDGMVVEDSSQEKSPCLYRGLNFVFDPRRTDPMVQINTNTSTKEERSCVGKCCLCGMPHDDYDNGHAPIENKEARCCKCRILLLVCDPCRQSVQCWGEDHKDGLPKLYCGVNTCSDYQVTGENPAALLLLVPPAEEA